MFLKNTSLEHLFIHGKNFGPFRENMTEIFNFVSFDGSPKTPIIYTKVQTNTDHSYF